MSHHFFSWSLFEFTCISLPVILCLTTFSELLLCVIISLLILVSITLFVSKYKSVSDSNASGSSSVSFQLICIFNYIQHSNRTTKTLFRQLALGLRRTRAQQILLKYLVRSCVYLQKSFELLLPTSKNYLKSQILS